MPDTLTSPGDRIEGEKILYSFGKVSHHKKKKEQRYKSKLSRNGEARVVAPVKRAKPKLQEPRELPRIVCKSAKAECGEVRQAKKKKHHGSHRSYQGYLVGRAWAEIEVPKH